MMTEGPMIIARTENYLKIVVDVFLARGFGGIYTVEIGDSTK